MDERIKKMNNNFISNYHIVFSHPSRSSLVKLINSYSGKTPISFSATPKKQKKEYLFSVSGSASADEGNGTSFLEELKELDDKITLLEIGGSFIDNLGRGFVNSLCQKQYTKTY